MNIIDIGIIVFIIFGAILGFKRGFTKELVKAVGFIVIVILAYFLKNPLSILFYEHLPFFKFGLLRGMEVLNIFMYEILAFILVLIVLSLILKAILMATTVFEKILNATIILGIPSKILGAIVGIIYHYVISFVILYSLTLVCVNSDIVKESDLRGKIVDNTPILSGFASKSINVVNEFIELKDKYDDKKVSEYDFEYQALELFLKYDIISSDSLSKLIEDGKISKFDNYNALINKYKGE